MCSRDSNGILILIEFKYELFHQIMDDNIQWLSDTIADHDVIINNIAYPNLTRIGIIIITSNIIMSINNTKQERNPQS